jgi:hypothetical protein
MIVDFADAVAKRSIDVSSVETAVDLAMGMVAVMLRIAVTQAPNEALISLQSVMVMRALGVTKSRALQLVSQPLPVLPSIGIRTKVLAQGWAEKSSPD